MVPDANDNRRAVPGRIKLRRAESQSEKLWIKPNRRKRRGQSDDQREQRGAAEVEMVKTKVVFPRPVSLTKTV